MTESLARILSAAPAPGSSARALTGFRRFIATLAPQERDLYARLADECAGLPSFLAAVFAGSPFLADLARRDIPRFLRLLTEAPDRSFERLIAGMDGLGGQDMSDADLMERLRLLRQEQALLIALCDLAGHWDVAQVTERLSRFARHAASCVLDVLLRRAARIGDLTLADSTSPQRGCGYFLLAMGKLGAHELNYSSDIDVIALYDPARASLRRPDEHQAFFVRLTQKLAHILTHQDHDGFVFRVDLRLRPDPGTYPLAISTTLALNYYEAIGQNWERAAYIKACPLAGDIEAGEAFLSELRPFIWRKYLDYAALSEIHAMKRQIEEVKDIADMDVAGRDIKLGVGGIREIEFFAQTQQLIGGGRDPSLRPRSTLEALQALAAHRWIDERTRRELAASYEELRRLEHRLQMVEDRQTHRLPVDKKALSAFARFAGFASSKALARRLDAVTSTVRRHYAALFDSKTEAATGLKGIALASGALEQSQRRMLLDLGFPDPDRLAQMVQGWQLGRYPSTRSATARARLAEITPRLIEALGESAEPDRTLAALDRFLGELPAGVQFFSLLRSNPHMLDLFTRLLSVAPRLSQDLARRPRLIDGLIDSLHRDDRDPLAGLEDHMAEAVAEARDYGEALDQARRIAQERVFLVGAHLIAGLVAVGEAGQAYSRIAGATVKALHLRAIDEHVRRFGTTPKPAHAIIALGRLGSREMTAASDLDLLLVYEDDHDAQSNGQKQLYAAEYYTRLTQRLVAALSAPTSEGIAYAVDFRLRPSGNKGPLASSLSAFAAYHAAEAWTWEHMALTRARVISTSSEPFAQRIAAGLVSILRRPRPARRLAGDVVDMRALLLKEKQAADGFDIRLIDGGLIDVEFLAQYLVLRHAHAHQDLIGRDSQAIFTQAIADGLVTRRDGRLLLRAARLFLVLLQLSRLCLEQGASLASASPGLAAFICQICDVASIDDLAQLISARSRDVKEVWARLLQNEGAEP